MAQNGSDSQNIANYTKTKTKQKHIENGNRCSNETEMNSHFCYRYNEITLQPWSFMTMSDRNKLYKLLPGAAPQIIGIHESPLLKRNLETIRTIKRFFLHKKKITKGNILISLTLSSNDGSSGSATVTGRLLRLALSPLSTSMRAGSPSSSPPSASCTRRSVMTASSSPARCS